MRQLLLVAVLVLAAGCSEMPLAISNLCQGSIVSVHDGSGRQLVSSLHYGDTVAVELQSREGSPVYLVAIGVDQDDPSIVLGRAETTRYRVRSYFSTSPAQMSPWVVDHLYGGPGCKR